MQLGTPHDNRKNFILTAGLLVTAGILGRMLPHAPNATPMTALGLAAGAALGLRFAVLIPLAILALTDILIGTYSPWVMASVYACFLMPAVLGSVFLRFNRQPLKIAGFATASSAVFFVVTNFAVWYGSNWYPPTWDGLMECYFAALPFARNMLTADLVWCATLFMGLSVIESLSATVVSQEAQQV